MRLLAWLVRAFLFFALFAFASNNLADASVHLFFGYEWRAPMVIVVLAAFAAGAVFGMLAMVPSWWRHRRVARRHAPLPEPPKPAAAGGVTVAPSDFGPEHPPRDGL